MKRGFELSVAVASQVLQISGGEGFIFNLMFGKMLRNSSQAVVVKKNLDCREICAVAAMVEYQKAADHAMVTRQGVRILVLKRFTRQGERGRGADGSADDHQPPGPFAGGLHGIQAAHDAFLSSGRGGDP